MAKQAMQLAYTFINPNTPQIFEQQLQRILIDKLLSQHRENRDRSVDRKEQTADENSCILSCLDGQGRAD